MIARKKKLPRYPWDEWFKKKRFELRKSRDFQCRTDTMGVQVRNAAMIRDMHVSIRIVGTTLFVEMRDE